MQVVQLPVSKSILIRKLFIHYIYYNEIFPIKSKVPEDIKIVFRNLLLIKSAAQRKDKQTVTINVKDCGAACRFFTALLATTEGQWLVTGTPRLMQRPIIPLIDALNSIGAEIKTSENGLFIHGKKLSSEKIKIDTSLSSQFLTAILLISKKIGLKQIVLKSSFRPSFSYVELTRKMLDEIGICTSVADNIITVSCNTLNKKYFREEADWSAAAYWYAVSLITGKSLFLNDLSIKSAQPDRNIIKIFGQLGVETKGVRGGVVICAKESDKKNGKTKFNLQDNPDIAPVLTTALTLLQKNSEISGLSTLNNKESKRLQVLKDELHEFAKIEIINNDILDITPEKSFPPHSKHLIFNSYNDHRMVMAFFLFSIFYDTEIKGFSSVRKSYPNF